MLRLAINLIEEFIAGIFIIAPSSILQNDFQRRERILD